MGFSICGDLDLILAQRTNNGVETIAGRVLFGASRLALRVCLKKLRMGVLSRQEV